MLVISSVDRLQKQKYCIASLEERRLYLNSPDIGRKMFRQSHFEDIGLKDSI